MRVYTLDKDMLVVRDWSEDTLLIYSYTDGYCVNRHIVRKCNYTINRHGATIIDNNTIILQEARKELWGWVSGYYRRYGIPKRRGLLTIDAVKDVIQSTGKLSCVIIPYNAIVIPEQIKHTDVTPCAAVSCDGFCRGCPAHDTVDVITNSEEGMAWWAENSNRRFYQLKRDVVYVRDVVKTPCLWTIGCNNLCAGCPAKDAEKLITYSEAIEWWRKHRSLQ